MRKLNWLVVCLLLGASIAHAQTTTQPAEMVDNPQFLAWQKFNIGSSSTLAGGLDGPTKMEITTTYTLLEKTPERVVVESAQQVKFMGQTQSPPPQRQTIEAKMPKFDPSKIGQETVEAMGRSFECKTWESTPSGGQSGSAKVYISEEVPGGLVKMEANAPQGKVTMLLQSFQAK